MKQNGWRRCLFVFLLSTAGGAAVMHSLAAQTAEQVSLPFVVKPLPGSLNDVPVLNSNSPEVVQEPGILVSTLEPPHPQKNGPHLMYPFKGRFDVFAHHIARADDGDLKTLYLGVLLKNDGQQPVDVDVLSAASYLSQPDAPFVPMDALVANDQGSVFAGPGDRVANDILRGVRQAGFPAKVTVPAQGAVMLASLPIPVRGLTPPLNGRTLLAKLSAPQTVYAASLAAFARVNADGSESAPTLADWLAVLKEGRLAGPREAMPSALDSTGPLVYGRAAGVSPGDKWTAKFDEPIDVSALADRKTPLAFPIATVLRGTFGTGQVQSPRMLVREANTAHHAHGNYGVEYELNLPLINKGTKNACVQIALSTPIKKDDRSESLAFFTEPGQRVHFRGTVKVTEGSNVKWWHVVQKQGEQGQPLFEATLRPRQASRVRLNFIYPADATPPQVVTVASH